MYLSDIERGGQNVRTSFWVRKIFLLEFAENAGNIAVGHIEGLFFFFLRFFFFKSMINQISYEIRYIYTYLVCLI